MHLYEQSLSRIMCLEPPYNPRYMGILYTSVSIISPKNENREFSRGYNWNDSGSSVAGIIGTIQPLPEAKFNGRRWNRLFGQPWISMTLCYSVAESSQFYNQKVISRTKWWYPVVRRIVHRWKISLNRPSIWACSVVEMHRNPLVAQPIKSRL